MDESVNWYFHTLADRVAVWWMQVYPIISSAEAVRIYTLVILLALIAAAGRTGYIAKKKLTKLEQEVLLNVKFPGPDPHEENSKDKRKAALDARAAERLEPFWCALWKLLLTGLVIPTIIFVIVSVNYHWFDPVGLPFVSLADKAPLQTVNNTTLAFFALNQFFHGALFDVLEVFNINAVAVTNNPNNYWFSSAVLLYRSLISAFIVALFFGWAQILFVKHTFRKEIKEEIARLKHGAQTAVENAS